MNEDAVSRVHVKKRRRSVLRQGFLACAIGIAGRSMYQLLIIRCTRFTLCVLWQAILYITLFFEDVPSDKLVYPMILSAAVILSYFVFDFYRIWKKDHILQNVKQNIDITMVNQAVKYFARSFIGKGLSVSIDLPEGRKYPAVE